MKKYEGDLTAENEKVYDYTEISGELIIPEKVKADFPCLKKFGGDLSIYSNAKLDAPALTSVGGYLSLIHI